MTQEELLFQDLYARVPYGVKTHYHYSNSLGRVLDEDRELDFSDIETLKYTIENPQDGWCEISWMPYLRPMSSMTEEECDMVEEILGDNCIFDFMSNGDIILKQGQFSQKKLTKLYDYYNSIHIDYRGLIPIGLALEAPEGMYTLNK